MATSEITVTVHLDMVMNGEPVTHVLNMPASLQQSEKGLHVYMDINTRALAKALLPDLVKLIRDSQRLEPGTRGF